MRLIDADTVGRIIISPRNKTQMLNMLEQIPIVEIIRCKDCKLFQTASCAIKTLDTDENGFCSYGVKR